MSPYVILTSSPGTQVEIINKNINVTSIDDIVDIGEFSWGPDVDSMGEWSKFVLITTV